MAKPKTYSGSVVAIYLKDGPSTWLKPCGLTQNSATFTKNMNEVDVPDCDDPDLPSWVAREVQSLDFSASGSGVLAAEAVQKWWDAFNATESIEARIYIGKPTDVTDGYFWQGMVHLSNFEVTGNRGERAQVSVNLVSDGEMVMTKITTAGP